MSLTIRISVVVIFCVYLFLMVSLQWTDWRSQGGHGDLPSYNALASDSSSDPVELCNAARAGFDQNTYLILFRQNRETTDITSIQSNYARFHPFLFAQTLPLYAVKPLYITILSALHHMAGMTIIDAAVLVSSLSLILLAGTLFVWLWGYSPAFSLVTCLVLALPGVFPILGMSSPDLPFTAVSVSAVFLIFVRRRYFPGLILLSASPLIRPDGIIFVMLVLIYLTFIDKQLTLRQLAVLAATQIVVNRFVYYLAGGYGWSSLIYMSFVSRVYTPAEAPPHLSFLQYLFVLLNFFSSSQGTPIVLYLFVTAGALALSLGRLNPIGYAGLAAALYAVAHVVLFPSYDDRFLAFSYIVVSIWFIEVVYSLLLVKRGSAESVIF